MKVIHIFFCSYCQNEHKLRDCYSHFLPFADDVSHKDGHRRLTYWVVAISLPSFSCLLDFCTYSYFLFVQDRVYRYICIVVPRGTVYSFYICMILFNIFFAFLCLVPPPHSPRPTPHHHPLPPSHTPPPPQSRPTPSPTALLPNSVV